MVKPNVVAIRRSLAVVAALVGVCILAVAAWDGFTLSRLIALNRALAAGTLAREPGPLPARFDFAAAAELERSGNHDAALERYKGVEKLGDRAWANAARYNAASIHLRQAMVVREASDEGHALPMLEQAKEGFRSVLRADPTQWNAKYNLERALRLAPEADDEQNDAAPAPHAAERAPTTMRGFTLGLP